MWCTREWSLGACPKLHGTTKERSEAAAGLEVGIRRQTGNLPNHRLLGLMGENVGFDSSGGLPEDGHEVRLRKVQTGPELDCVARRFADEEVEGGNLDTLISAHCKTGCDR